MTRNETRVVVAAVSASLVLAAYGIVAILNPWPDALFQTDFIPRG